MTNEIRMTNVDVIPRSAEGSGWPYADLQNADSSADLRMTLFSIRALTFIRAWVFRHSLLKR